MEISDQANKPAANPTSWTSVDAGAATDSGDQFASLAVRRGKVRTPGLADHLQQLGPQYGGRVVVQDAEVVVRHRDAATDRGERPRLDRRIGVVQQLRHVPDLSGRLRHGQPEHPLVRRPAPQLPEKRVGVT